MKKLLSVLLVTALVLAALPLTALPVFAVTSGDFEYKVLSETDKTCKITDYTGSATALEIPSELDGYTVTSIGSDAFYDCIALKSITIPNSVTSIGWYAFKDCVALTSITIPNSVTEIGAWAFSGCTALESITLPDSVTSIGNYAFSGCTALTSITIPNSVTSIGWYAFEDCTALTSITIPDSVTSIDVGAFRGCTSLTSITIPDSVTSIDYGAFSGCTSLTGVIIPDSVTSIGGESFYGCASLTSITIPDSVTSIGNDAFDNTAYYNDATRWENDVLYIGNHLIEANDTLSGAYNIKAGTKTIADYAFSRCTSLTGIAIPDSVTSIGAYAFESCTALTGITIPDSVTSIDWGAFENCTSLKNITIPDSVTSIGEDAFCNTAYYNDSTHWENDVLYIGNHLIEANDTLSGAYTVRAGTKTIADYAFSRCTSLTGIAIPDSVTSIDDCAFYYCTALASITIPDSVTSIGNDAFDNTAYYNDATRWENDVLYIGNHLIEAKNTLSGAYTVRAGTKTVAGRAFIFCAALTSIIIPDSVVSICDWAFSRCTALESITIPNSVTSIGEDAFYGCTLLTTIYGYTASYAETYAGENGYTFIALDLVKNDETDVSVVFPPENLPAENTVLNVEKLSAEENAITYDISLTVNGEAVQPASAVTVKIPVPEAMDGAQCKVYRQEADGTYTDMQATYQNGYMVFTTDHFSTYILTTKRLGICLGDLNGDDKINAVDARWVLQAASGVRTFDATQTAAADVNGDGKVNAVDARWILQIASGSRTV